MIHGILLVPILAVGFVTALDPIENYREGSCLKVQPVKASREFVDSLLYIPMGNKYNFYRAATALPHYGAMSEEDLKSEACYTRNTTTTLPNSIGSVIGFGGIPLNAYTTIPRPGILFYGVSTNPANRVELIDIVTLTDHKTFAFVVVCFFGNGLEERSWALAASTPYLDSRTRKAVEDHAISLGFKKENFVLLTYDRCERYNPLLDESRGVGKAARGSRRG